MDVAIAARLHAPSPQQQPYDFSVSLQREAKTWRKIASKLRPGFIDDLRNGRVEHHLSTEGQDRWVDEVAFNASTGLFALESGAFDGVYASNTLWLEAKRGWNCLLVEANPLLLQPILSARRRCHVFSGGLQMSSSPVVSADFMVGSNMGGFVSHLDPQTMGVTKRLARLLLKDSGQKSTSTGAGASIRSVPSFPLHRVLAAIGRDVVDYWSLDTEGSEPDILAHANFSAIEVGVLSVEHNGVRERRLRSCSTLEQNGFVRVCRTAKDDFFANPSYYRRRGLPLPTGGASCAPLYRPQMRLRDEKKVSMHLQHKQRLHKKVPPGLLERVS